VVNLNAGTIGGGTPSIGMNVFVYQQVRYRFAPLGGAAGAGRAVAPGAERRIR
jgi:hypothetical protein